MSPDETFVAELARALRMVGLEAIVVGSGGAALLGVPILTQDLDILVRDTPRNRQKLEALCQALGASLVEISPLTGSRRLVGLRVGVDVLFDEIAGGLRFESLRSRARTVELPNAQVRVASLADIVASKEAAGRPKDLAQLPILRDTLKVIEARTRIDDGDRRTTPRRRQKRK